MPPVGPIKRRDLIRYLKSAGFEGPLPGTKHQAMQRGDVVIRLPNPHKGDIGPNLLLRILRQAGISRDDWDAL
jgi:predicted RNA binding protein YcfA (HicA-like mRNA interferase family)